MPPYEDTQHYARFRPREDLAREDEEEQSDTCRVRPRFADARPRSPWDSPVRDYPRGRYGEGSPNLAKGQSKGSKGFRPFDACPYCANSITPDVTVPRLHHITAAAMVREVKEVKAKVRVRHSIVIGVKRI